jgi:hypothetical protein
LSIVNCPLLRPPYIPPPLCAGQGDEETGRHGVSSPRRPGLDPSLSPCFT